MSEHTDFQTECCPVLEDVKQCDVMDFRYRLPFRPRLAGDLARQNIRVEVVLRFRLERCPGPLTKGDLAYTTTLLPGEQVRLFTSDRRSRFTFDSESKVSYRNQSMSTESYYMAGMAQSMSNLSVLDQSKATSDFSESSFGGGAGGGFSLFGLVSFGGSVSGSSHNAHSASTFVRSLSQHAESSSRHVETGTHAANSISIGEVESRTHTEGESQDHFESASRVFKNPNQCHALTFYFFRINKSQTVRWTLEAIERHVIDAAAPTGVDLNPPTSAGGVSATPIGILATAKDRIEVEQRARASVLAAQREFLTEGVNRTAFAANAFAAADQGALPANAVKAALAAVDKELAAAGLLDPKTGEVSQEAKRLYGWERTIVLPTPGVMVKGCLDECEVCEPNLDKAIQLDLERKQLENELLKKKIELLEKSQEYRCCAHEEENDD
ncbi:MAG: hypothetical protein KA765_07395 [Thermoflexales bacterium]|nr:hypothetical protein [Thermoflexales bacterium]